MPCGIITLFGGMLYQVICYSNIWSKCRLVVTDLYEQSAAHYWHDLPSYYVLSSHMSWNALPSSLLQPRCQLQVAIISGLRGGEVAEVE